MIKREAQRVYCHVDSPFRTSSVRVHAKSQPQTHCGIPWIVYIDLERIVPSFEPYMELFLPLSLICHLIHPVLGMSRRREIE